MQSDKAWTVDETRAWELVLAVKAQADRVLRAESPVSESGYTVGPLTVSATGHWRSRGPVTLAAEHLFNLFLPLCASGRPFALAQIGQSLDGRIATETGVSHYINGADGLTHLHRLRAIVDAVVVGTGTAVADDPQLTVRNCPGESPVRVVIDRQRRVPDSHQLFQDAQAPTLRLVRGHTESNNALVEDIALPRHADGDCPVTVILDLLAERGLHRVLIEGGGDTVSRFVSAGALDYLHVIVAPMIIGSGRPGFTLPTLDTLEHALRPTCQSVNLGTDVLFALDLRSTGQMTTD